MSHAALRRRWRLGATAAVIVVGLTATLGWQRGHELAAATTPPMPHDANLCLAAPAGDRYTTLQPGGTTILPNGRLLTPYGVSVRVAPHPFGMALSPDGRTLVTANSGTSPFSISVVRGLDTAAPQVIQIPPGPTTLPETLNANFMGLAFAPNSRTLYVSGGNDGTIVTFDLVANVRTGFCRLDVPFDGQEYRDSYVGDLTLSRDGSRLYALDQANFRLVTIDTSTGKIVASTPTGRYPFGLGLSPDDSYAYVTNVGMFQYSFIPGFDPDKPRETGLAFPPFGFPSPEAESGAAVEGKNVPGLGDPNAPESFSVWKYDLRDPAGPHVVAKVKTGRLVGESVNGVPAVGGSGPSAVVEGRSRVYVSNANNDSVTVIDIVNNKPIAQIDLAPTTALGQLRGNIPFGVALSPDESRLFVAEAGINAVAVIDTLTNQVLGRIPTGWFPSKLAVSSDGRRLYVVNAKGYGAGPNGGQGYTPGPEGTYVGALQKGTVEIIPIPSPRELTRLSRVVLVNNGFLPAAAPHDPENPIPVLAGRGSEEIRHVVFITKENRTFDEVFGDTLFASGRRVNADLSLARYGRNATVTNQANTQRVENVNVMPNHQELARRFGYSDNFYCDSDVSADGHRWLVGVYPNTFVETSWPASYGNRRELRYKTTAVGRLGFTESNSAVDPEDYLEAGSIWEHLARYNVSFRNYGEGFEFAGIFEDPGMKPTGARLPVNTPMPKVLFDNTHREFPTYNTNIPDQYRVDQFLKEFNARYANGNEALPAFVNIYLPNDHGSRERPADGYPFRASYMADNDLALGRVVEALSQSKYWPSTAIFVTEDDSQDGLDHVDAHRSLLLVISPWTKRGYLSHRHTSIASITKTIDLILGLPFLNQYDAAAGDLRDMFHGTPDTRPYQALPADPRIFDPAKAKDPTEPVPAGQQARAEPLDDPVTIARDHAERLRVHPHQTRSPARRSRSVARRPQPPR
jgi:YVTN family beta-propeller protein